MGIGLFSFRGYFVAVFSMGFITLTTLIADYTQHMCRNRAMAVWLFVIAAMVLAMVILGGLTRLTHSGLSMVDWRPFTGWFPPFNESAWQVLFEQYQKFPEFREKNPDMTPAGFKSIFWLEFLHRLWGRLIGLAFFVPWLVFFVRRWVNRAMLIRYAIIMIMGASQGVLGWYMVKSGLIDQPDVSQYRLAAHLILALFIYGYILWVALTLWQNTEFIISWSRLSLGAGLLVILVFSTAFSGALVAGLNAGLIYNTFPLMDGKFVPDGLFDMKPFHVNFFENITTVQFNHRVFAEGTCFACVAFWLYARRQAISDSLTLAMKWLVIVVIMQVILGISTLVMAIPVSLAVIHQSGAVVLVGCSIWVLKETMVCMK